VHVWPEGMRRTSRIGRTRMGNPTRMWERPCGTVAECCRMRSLWAMLLLVWMLLLLL